MLLKEDLMKKSFFLILVCICCSCVAPLQLGKNQNSLDTEYAIDVNKASNCNFKSQAVMELPCITFYTEPTKEQWNILRQINFPYHLHLAFLSPASNRMANLKDLDMLQYLEVTNEFITDEIFQHIKDLPLLERVRITNCSRLTNRGLECLADVKKLKKLEIYNCEQITDWGFRNFCQHKSLKSCYIHDCDNITNSVISIIVQIPNLSRISLWNNQSKFEEMDIEQFLSCHALEVVALSPCNNITQENVEKLLSKHSQMRLLYIDKCCKINNSEAKEIQKQYPDCAISISQYSNSKTDRK